MSKINLIVCGSGDRMMHKIFFAEEAVYVQCKDRQNNKEKSDYGIQREC